VQCLSGEDEDDCPVVGYACRNVRQTVPNALVCNGSPDCADGSDELPDCEVVLTCDNRPIPDYAVCDGVKTCNNGADEAPDCAVAMCP